MEASEGVNLDAEDVYGDNLFVWNPGYLQSTSPLVGVALTIEDRVVRDVPARDDVVIEFANVNQGSRYLQGPPPAEGN